MSGEFDVTFVSVNSVVSIRNTADLANIWSDTKKWSKYGVKG